MSLIAKLTMMHLPIPENQSISVHYILPDTYFSNLETQKGVRQRGSKHITGWEAPEARPSGPTCPADTGGGGATVRCPPGVALGLWVAHHVHSRWHWARPGPPAGLSPSPVPCGLKTGLRLHPPKSALVTAPSLCLEELVRPPQPLAQGIAAL